jgi:hypothetical protein
VVHLLMTRLDDVKEHSRRQDVAADDSEGIDRGKFQSAGGIGLW